MLESPKPFTGVNLNFHRVGRKIVGFFEHNPAPEENGNQQHERNETPQELKGIVVGNVGSFVVIGFAAVLVDEVHHPAHHDHEEENAEIQNKVVNRVDF